MCFLMTSMEAPTSYIDAPPPHSQWVPIHYSSIITYIIKGVKFEGELIYRFLLITLPLLHTL